MSTGRKMVSSHCDIIACIFVDFCVFCVFVLFCFLFFFCFFTRTTTELSKLENWEAQS